MVTDATIPNGYKLTEVGVIPSDWDVAELSSLVQKDRKIRYGIVQPGKYDSQGRYMVRGQDYSFGWVNPEELFKVGPIVEEKYKNARLQEGDIIITIVGASTGHVEIVPTWLNGANITQTTARVAIDANKASGSFCKYLLISKYGKSQVSNFIKGGAQPGLNICDVEKFIVPLPPTKAEQVAIATVLTDADALISSLEELITKKRNIKQGAMQELLTGKKRLPGFSGKWEENSLIKLADSKKELFDDGDWIEAEYLTESGIRLIQTGNIGEGVFLEKENRKYISQRSFDILRCKEIREGDILICRLAEPAGRACIMPNIGEDKMITAVDISIFRPLKGLADRRYLVNYFSSNDWFNVINEKCGGSTRTRIARGALGKIKLLLPPLPEQTAISLVLSDMDVEIEALEQKLDKYKMIKQGMMKELLTGKTRLI